MQRAHHRRRHFHYRIREMFRQVPEKRSDFFSLKIAAYTGASIAYRVYKVTESLLAPRFPPPQDDTLKMDEGYAFDDAQMRIFLTSTMADLNAQGLTFTFDDDFVTTATTSTLSDLRVAITGATH